MEDAHGGEEAMRPLAGLISGRGFDRFQIGLQSRFAAYRLRYDLTYCEPTDDPAMRLDFESPLHLGRVTVWESGLCDLEALEKTSGATVFWEHHELRSEREFHETYPRLVIFLRDAARLPGVDRLDQRKDASG